MGMPIRNAFAIIVGFIYEKQNLRFPLFVYAYLAYKRQYGVTNDYTIDGDAAALRYRDYVRNFPYDAEDFASFEFTAQQAREAIEFAATIYADFPQVDADFYEHLEEVAGANYGDAYERPYAAANAYRAPDSFHQ